MIEDNAKQESKRNDNPEGWIVHKGRIGGWLWIVVGLGDRLSRDLLLNLILVVHIFELPLIALTIASISN